jgi:hypothetical protein
MSQPPCCSQVVVDPLAALPIGQICRSAFPASKFQRDLCLSPTNLSRSISKPF